MGDRTGATATPGAECGKRGNKDLNRRLVGEKSSRDKEKKFVNLWLFGECSDIAVVSSAFDKHLIRFCCDVVVGM
jgi:hypothetical protein